jgi:hypothetical protein
LIRTHDSSDLDMIDPVAVATRISDNLSLFQEEKLPSVFKYLNAENILVAMSLAARNNDTEKFERYKKLINSKIDKSNLDDNLKRDLRSAVNEVSYVTPKFTLGVLAGEIKKIGSSDKSMVSITIKHNKFDETLQRVFDMGQKQTKKFLNAYGVASFDQKNYLLGKYKDKNVLELNVE